MSTAADATIRWLHLSDLHIRARGGPAKQGDQSDVLQAFLRFCRGEMHKVHRFHPDFVFITGDLAFTGKADDYTAGDGLSVRKFLDELLAAIPGLEKSRLFLVPGNHDANRERINKADAKFDLDLAERARSADDPSALWGEIVDRLYPDKEDDFYTRDGLLRRHEEFAAFCVDYFGPDRYPGYSADSLGQKIQPVLSYAQCLRFPRSSHKLGLAGLCSAWSSQSLYKASGGKDDADREGTQFLCIKTVRDAIDKLSGADFRLALFHHPLLWLVQPEQDRLVMEDSLYGQFDMILTGHTHRAERLRLQPFQGLRAWHSSAGSLFDSWARCNAFNLVELSLDNRQGRRMVVTWNNGVWAPSLHLAPGSTDGWKEFSLDQPEAGGSSPAGSGPASAPPADVAGYCRELLKGLTITLIADAKRRCEVDRLYVEMDVTYTTPRRPEDDREEEQERPDHPGGTRERGKWPDESPREKDRRRQPAAVQRVRLCEALRDNPAAVLVAGPGAGKTTSLQWLAHYAGRQFLPSGEGLPAELTWLAGLTPILLTARTLVDEREREIAAAQDHPAPPARDWLYRFLEKEAGEKRLCPQAPQCAREALESGHGLLLIDGLDEVPAAMRRWVVELAEQFSGNRLVYSARPGGYEPGDHRPGTRPLFLLPFDRPRMELYLDHWFDYRRRWTDKALAEPEIAGRRREIFRAIDASEAIRALAETPLLLATMACVQEVDIHLPENRAELYHRCTLLLLGRWNEELRPPAGVEPGKETRALIEKIGGWDFAKRAQVFEAMAHALFTSRTQQLNPAVERDELVQLLRAAIEKIVAAEGGTPANARVQAEAMLDLAAHRSGIVVESRPGRFSFLHATFQEYLTARVFRGASPGPAGRWYDPLVTHCHEPRWREVIRLTAAELIREPSEDKTVRLNELMAGIAARLEAEIPGTEAWLEIADTAIGCLEDLLDRRFPAVRTIAEVVIDAAGRADVSPFDALPRTVVLALRLPACLARRRMVGEIDLDGLIAVCVASCCSWEPPLEVIWPSARALAGDADADTRARLLRAIERLGPFRDESQDLLLGALADLCRPGVVENQVRRLALEASAFPLADLAMVHVPPEEVPRWRSTIPSCLQAGRLFPACALIVNPLEIWTAADYAAGAVRAFSAYSSPETGIRVLRGLLAQAATRPDALQALRDGLQDRDPDIAASSAGLLAAEEQLPAAERARAAVRAFYADSSRESGVRVLRGLLAQADARPDALQALRDGLQDRDPDIAVTSAGLLAAEEQLPAAEGARAAVRAFYADSSRESGVRVLRGLLAQAASRQDALQALRDGLQDDDPDIAASSAGLLAAEEQLPAAERARVAVRAFYADSSRESGIRLLRGLLAQVATRPDALQALRDGLQDDDPDIAGNSAGLLAAEEQLPAAERARAAVRAFSSDSSRESGVRVLRGLLAQAATRPDALQALRDGLQDRDRDIAASSAGLLAAEEQLPAAERARAAVRAFSADSSRESGIRLLRGLLAQAATRPDALQALRDGLQDRDRDIAASSAGLLAAEEQLPAAERARAAVRAFASYRSRESGVRVLRGLLAQAATRPDALQALRNGLLDRDRDIAASSAGLLAAEEQLPAAEGARAAVRAFSSFSSRESGVLLRGLLAQAATRPDALQALRDGLRNSDRSIQEASRRLLVEAGEMEREG